MLMVSAATVLGMLGVMALVGFPWALLTFLVFPPTVVGMAFFILWWEGLGGR